MGSIFSKKALKKITSVTLVFSLIASTLSNYQPQEVEAKESSKNNKVTIVKELTDERTENSNTYLLSDGSKRVDICSENIRYKEENKLQDYDSTVTALGRKEKDKLKETGCNAKPSDYIGVNEQGDVKQYFPKDISADGVITTYGDYTLSINPIEDEEKYEVSTDENVVSYKSKNSDMEYRYTSLFNGVKEEIILDSKPESYDFEFDVKQENIELKLENKAIYLLDKETKEKVGYIMPPNITDGEGNTDYESIRYEIEKNKIKVTVDETYFENENLIYPITIDPTPVWFSGTLSTAVVNSMTYIAGMNLHSSTLNLEKSCNTRQPYVGTEQRVYLDTSKIASGESFIQGPGDIKDKYIEQATLSIRENESSYKNGTVEIYKPEEAFDTKTITWNNQPKISERLIGSCKFTNTPGKAHLIDITEWAQDIASGVMEDTGMVFVAKEEGTGDSFNGPELPGQGYMWISITYRDIDRYDASVSVNAEYNDSDSTFDIQVEDNGINSKEQEAQKKEETSESLSVSGYKVFIRKDDSKIFECTDQGKSIPETIQISEKGIGKKFDLRLCVAYSDGTVMPSNIISFEKKKQENNDESATSEQYEQTTMDTDGDGLEDGYEIWDFKTMWNTEIADSTEENPKYEQDTDGDGLPDGYEVFTLGTDPAVANEENADSDGDGWTDLKEYQKGTDPWLYDSDFDGLRDKDDVGDNNPRKTDNPRLKGTDRSVASAAKVHKGLYDREYSENENGVTVTYIANIYRGDIKSIYSDYGDAKINKRLKYFYDAKGNNTAIVEQYDDNDTQTICITYTYDENGNVEFICDQQTKYTMEYNSDNKITNLQVGDRTLVSYEYSHKQNDSGNESGESTGDSVENTDEQITYYGTGDDRQKVRTVTTEYKVDSEDDAAVAEKTEVFYNDEKTPSYVTSVNSSGQMLNLTDNTENTQLAYNYEYNDNTTRVTRSDGFIKEVVQNEDEENKKSTLTTKYEYKALDDKKETLVSKIETDSSDGDKIKNRTTLYNGDVLSETMSDDGKSCVTDLYSDKYKKNILKYNSVEDDSTHRTFNIEKYGENKNIDYTYDRAGNITRIKTDGKLTNAYEYDAHGRLTWEYDYDVSRAYEYGYTTTGNVEAKHTYVINDNGKLVEQDDELRKYSYGNGDWPDQLTKYCGKEITYDSSGNPKEYYNGMSFNWYRGRQLQEATLANGNRVTYKYNEDGLRTYKDTEKTTTTYEWDETKLIRETVTYKKTGKKYDIWYMYDSANNVIGFEYSQLSEINETLKTTRIYYEKNLQGDVTGLLDARGAEIASYTYDAWGNVIADTEKSFCYEGYEVPFELNHVLYRGYYYDGSCTDTESDTNLYYLQSRYYDAEVGRFINADDVNTIFIEENEIYKDNYYIYCNSNPISLIDKNGHAPKRKIIKFTYNRSKVYNYMKKYYSVKRRKIRFWLYKGYNQKFPYFSSDCTNFASQCLWTGGINMSSNWYCMPCIQGIGFAYTKSWTTVVEQRKYVKKYFSNKSFKIVKKVTKQQMKNYINRFHPKVGDMIYFYSSKKKRYSHTAIISSVTADKINYAAHSDSRFNKDLREPLQGDYYDHVEICHIKERGSFYE